MGADMIGYFLTVPPKPESILKPRIEAIEKALELPKDPASDEFASSIKAFRKALAKAGVKLDGQDYAELDGEALVPTVMEDLKIVKETKLSGDMGNRDTAWIELPLKIRVFFAGDMSWGDEPDGGGYTTFRAFWRLGLGDALYEAAGKLMKGGKRK